MSSSSPITTQHLCDNDAHDDDPTADGQHESRPAATVLMTWPDDRFIPAYACDRCAIQSVQIYVLDAFEDGARHPVLIEPAGGAS